MRAWVLAIAIAVIAASACGGSPKPPPRKATAAARGKVQRGKASWYGAYHHGKLTASGERFNKNALTAAHRRLRFGTRVRVINLKNGRSVIVRINDRGPFGGKGRIIDLSEAAAKKLGMIDAGVVPVKLEILR
jgi:rare lipoprotein A